MKPILKTVFYVILLSLLLTACTSLHPTETTAPAAPSEGPEVFLEALLSQVGSSGEILGTDQRYAAWFARRQNYRVEPWEDEDVAWCVCFLYWGIDRCGDSVTFDFDDPKIRTADVDLLWSYFTDSAQTTKDPRPGDLVFFDTDPEDADASVNHAGAVVKIEGPTIYIIEGNTLRGRNHPTGTAAVLEYDLSDPAILGYGKLNWK